MNRIGQEPVSAYSDLSAKQLKLKLYEESLKHHKETSLLQVELDTLKRAKVGTEQRLDELFATIQSISDDVPSNNQEHRESSELLVHRYETIIRAMNDQQKRMKTSTDGIVRALMDQLADCMEHQVKSDLLHLEEIAAANDKEQAKKKAHSEQATTEAPMDKSLRQELRRLRVENARLKESCNFSNGQNEERQTTQNTGIVNEDAIEWLGQEVLSLLQSLEQETKSHLDAKTLPSSEILDSIKDAKAHVKAKFVGFCDRVECSDNRGRERKQQEDKETVWDSAQAEYSRNVAPNPAGVVSGQDALDTLQKEVSQILTSLSDKDANIHRLKEEIKEYKVREHSLQEELRLRNRQFRWGTLKLDFDPLKRWHSFNEDEYTFEKDCCSEFEEKTVDETIFEEEQTIDETFCDETIYEEITVV